MGIPLRYDIQRSIYMTKEQLQQLPNEELVAMLLIEDHNIESCYRKKEEFKDNENFMDLFNTFTKNYSEVYDEIIRRMSK